MKSLSARNASVVSGVRSYLRKLANRRIAGTVTADDAHRYMNQYESLNGKIRTRLAITNSAFLGGNFESVGMVPSTRPEARSRQITEWSLV